MEATQIIRRPIVTEKTNRLKESQNKVTFEVDPQACKNEIKRAVEALFKVKVKKVNTTRVPGKQKRFGFHMFRRPDIKKAVVTLRAGDKIEFFEGA